MSQFLQNEHSRTQWKEKAKAARPGRALRATREGSYQAERDQLHPRSQRVSGRVRELEAEAGRTRQRPKATWSTSPCNSFLRPGIAFARSRVSWLCWLSRFASKQTPCPQTIIIG